MGKRKRRARATNQDSAADAGSEHRQRRVETTPPGGAQPGSGRWRSHLKTIAVVVVVAAVLVSLVVGQIKPSSGSLTASAQPAQGKELYDKNCAACHGPGGRGLPGWQYQPRAAPPLDSSAHAWHHEDAQLLAMILDKPAPDSVMPAWRGVLTRENALDVIAYIKSLWTPYIRENCQGAKHMSCMSHR